MRIKNFTLLTLALFLMSVVAFAQKSTSSQKTLTPYQQILQAKRTGQLTKENASAFKFAKPALPQNMQKAKANKQVLPVALKAPAKVAKQQDVFASSFVGKAKTPRRAGTQAYTYSFVQAMNGWTTIDADGDGYAWELSSQPGHDGELGTMSSASYAGGALTPDNYLVSPKMKLDGKLTFYACGQDAAYAAEHFGVAVSTASGTAAADFTMVTEEWVMTAAPSLAPTANFNAPASTFRSARRVQGQWYKYEVDLSSFAGAEGYVAIRHFNCTDMFRLNVDDITLETSQMIDAYDPNLEVAPEKVELPAGAEVTPYYTIGGTLAVYTSNGWTDYTKKVKNINVAFVGTDAYIQGLAYWQQESWVKGTVADNKITVPSGQFVGDGEYLNGMDEQGGFLENYTFTIDTEAGTITADGYIAESASATKNSLYAYWITPVFTLTAPVDPRVTPPAGLVTEDWTIARYFYDGEDETPEEKVIQVGFDGNDVYVQGFSEYMEDENWIKGTLSEDGKSITFASGQYYGALESQGEIYDLYFAGYDLTTNALAPVTVAYDALAGTMTWPETVLVLENGEEAEVGMYGYFTEIVAMVKGTAPEPLAAPDIVTTEWYFKSQSLVSQENEETGETETVVVDYNLNVHVGIAGTDVFVKGISEDLPDAWIKGTLDPATNKVTFPTGQHIGTYLYWFWEFEYFFDGYGQNGFEDVVMDYDATAKTLTMESPLYLLINPYWLLVDPNLILANVQLSEIADVAATPAQPEILESRLAGTSYPNITVNIPNTDKDGNPILTSKLAYQYFYKVGDTVTPLTLTTDLYTGLTEDMTEIPYTFTDDWDVYNYRLYLNMDFSSWDQIGIQSIYRGGDAENKSEIFWYDVYQPAPAEVTVAAGGDISAALAENAAAMKDAYTKPSDITINLAAGDYTISNSISAAGNVIINGNGAKIDASALTGPFILMSTEPCVNPIIKEEDGSVVSYPIDGIIIKDVTISGLTQQLIYANKVKYLMNMVLVDNSVIGIAGATKKTIFDFNGGGNVCALSVNNSTLWADDATQWQNGGFYSSQSGQDVVSLGGESQITSITSSTLYNIAKGKTTSTRRKNSQKWMTYEVKSSVIVNSGKKGEFYAGLNGGNANGGVWDISNNTVRFDGEDVNEAEATKAKLGDGVIAIDGDPGFKDAATGDFTLNESSQQRKYFIGDPRWFTDRYVPAAVTAAIDVNVPATLGIMDGEVGPTDLYYFLEDYLKDSENPAYIKLTLEPGAKYVISRPLTVITAIEIAGDAENPATIDATELGANPFIRINNDWAPTEGPNEKGFYANVYNVSFKNFNLTGLKGQVFYANKQKYLIPYLTVDNCQLRQEGASKKTFFDFNGGGFVENLTINNSTLSADDATQWQNGGFFSTQSGTKFDDCGAQQMKFVLTNNTFYNIAKGKTLSSLRENSKNWMSFEVFNNVIVNSGKKGQFVKGLNAGNNNATPSWLVNYNSFQWTTDNKTFEDINEMEASGADKCGISGSIEGVIAFKYAVTDEEPAAAILVGNYTLDECVQKTAKIGDPRWLKDNVPTGIQNVNAEQLSEGAWYTLQGVRVDKPSKGVFIHNGKKVVMK